MGRPRGGRERLAIALASRTLSALEEATGKPALILEEPELGVFTTVRVSQLYLLDKNHGFWQDIFFSSFRTCQKELCRIILSMWPPRCLENMWKEVLLSWMSGMVIELIQINSWQDYYLPEAG